VKKSEKMLLAILGIGGVVVAGVAAVFGPGTNIPEAAREILALIRKRAIAA
jgi:methylmalonyl-CoA mutase cobalamin-binding subunit